MKMQLFLIIISAILFVANVSQAALVFFDTADPLVEPGETISVTIFSTVETEFIRMDRISDDAGGTASNLYLNPNYNGPTFSEGTAVNSGGVLIEGVIGGEITPALPTISGVLYSFDYTVPVDVLYAQIINIFPDPSNGAINQVYTSEYVTPDNLSLTVVPEPGSIVLLGLGSLLLART